MALSASTQPVLLLVCATTALLGPGGLSAQATVGEAYAHPMVVGYSGARVVGFDVQESDSTTFALGPISPTYGHTAPLRLWGRTHRSLYLMPTGTTAPSVADWYRSQLRAGGFTPLFSCVRTACGHLFELIVPDDPPLLQYAFGGLIGERHYIVARVHLDDRDVFVAVCIARHESPLPWMAGRVIAQVDIVEVARGTSVLAAVAAPWSGVHTRHYR